MKHLKILLMVVFLLGLGSSSVFAENQTWADRDFNFKNINAVYLEEPMYSNDIDEEITQRLIEDTFYNGADKLKNVEALTERRMRSKLLRYKLTDIDAIADEAERQKVWQDAVNEYAEVIITEEIQEYWIDKVWQEPSYYTTTEYYDYSYWKDGKYYEVKVPYEKEHWVDGYYRYNAHIKVKFEVFSTKDNRMVYTYVDYREAEKDLIDMYKRIVKDFYSGFDKQLRK